MQLPREPLSGNPIDWRWGVQVVRCLRELYAAVRKLGARQVRRIREAAADQTRHPFQCYRSPYTGGSSEPPEDQVFRVRIRVGPVKNLFPENINQEFVCPPSATTIFWVQGTFNGEGTLLSVIIDSGSAVSSDPDGSEDNAPPVSRRPLFSVTTDADGITSIAQFVQHPLDVTPVVRAVTCAGNIMAYFWGETLSVYVTSTGGDD